MTCSVFELLVKLTTDDLFGIVACTGGWDSIHRNCNDKVSCATLQDDIGNALAQPKSMACTCALLLLFLDTVLVIIMSENTECDKQHYQRLQNEWSEQWSVEHSPDPSLSSDLNSLLGFVWGFPSLPDQDNRLYRVFWTVLIRDLLTWICASKAVAKLSSSVT